MIKDRFIMLTSLLQDGTIKILNRDSGGLVNITLPKCLWMQLTVEDISRSIQGDLNRVFVKRVEYSLTSETNTHVTIQFQV